MNKAVVTLGSLIIAITLPAGSIATYKHHHGDGFSHRSPHAGSPISNVFVSNTGDGSLSLVRCVTKKQKAKRRHWWYYRWRRPQLTIECKEKDRMDVGFSTSWPANQYRGKSAWWWTGLNGEVVGLKARRSLKSLSNDDNFVFVDTYVEPGLPDSGSNFIGISPNGRTAWNAAREVDQIQEIDTDPRSPSFGTILTSITVPDLDPDSPATETRGAARPCDATLTPNGRYFLEPDLAGESMTVVDTRTAEIIWQVMPPQLDPTEKVLPFMATTNGKIVLIENFEAPSGSYDIWDIRNLPAEPVHLKKLSAEDGLGVGPQTSEFTPDGNFAYLMMQGVSDADVESSDASRIDVLDVRRHSRTYLEIVRSIELPKNCGARTGDFSNDGHFFFVGCPDRNELVVVSNKSQKMVATVAVGEAPRGVIVR